MSTAARLALALAFVLLDASSDTPDLIVLQDGEEIECRVLYEDDETVVYTEKRKAEEVPRSEVASVQSIERSLREALDRFTALSPGDVAGLLDLARFCESRELHGEARHLRIRVLTLDPENEEAWTKLGGVHTDRRGWRIKVRGRFLSIEQLRERVSDWKNAMELPTAHFLLKTDADPERALDLALDLERAYLAFYDLLGPVLRLYPFDEVPQIHVYASTDDYPRPPIEDQVAWYSRPGNELYVDAQRATVVPQAVVAELADLMVFNAFKRTLGKTGSAPAWVRSAIGQAFAAGFRRDPGRASWDLSQPIAAHFRAHATAPQPLSLSDVVEAAWGAFEGGPTPELYGAQAYTLMHFLAHADDGALRPALGAYLVRAFGGQGATTHLEKAVGLDDDEIEERWLAWSKRQAGG